MIHTWSDQKTPNNFGNIFLFVTFLRKHLEQIHTRSNQKRPDDFGDIFLFKAFFVETFGENP